MARGVGARYPPTALVSLALVVIALMAWVVLLGGAAGLQKDADTVYSLLNLYNTGSQTGGVPLLSFGDLKPQSTSSNFISYEWYKAVFQVLVLLAALGALATGQIYRCRLALVALLAALGVLFSDASNTFYYLFLNVHNNPGVPKKIRREVVSYFAGCIMAATLDFLLVISLGLGSDSAAHAPATSAATTGPAPGIKDTGNGAGPHV